LELNAECMEEFNSGQGDYFKNNNNNNSSNNKMIIRAVKPTELSVNARACWSSTAWDCEPAPGAPSRAGEHAQAGGDPGDNVFESRGASNSKLARCRGKLWARRQREGGREPGGLQIEGAATQVGVLGEVPRLGPSPALHCLSCGAVAGEFWISAGACQAFED